MTGTTPTTTTRTFTRAAFSWGHKALTAEFTETADGFLTMSLEPGTPVALPLAEITTPAHGTGWSGPRSAPGSLGTRLRLHDRHASFDGSWHRLTLELREPGTGLTVLLQLSSPDGVPVLRSRLTLRNDGDRPLHLTSVSSLALGGLGSPGSLDVHRARNTWLAECRWYSEPLADTLVDFGRPAHQHDSHARLALAGRGSWPSDGHLPMGALTDRENGRCMVWQVESPAGWRWELTEIDGSTCLTVHGPTDEDHQHREVLAPGGLFTTVTAALALGGTFGDAMAALTAYRRKARRPHRDHVTLPVVFNDYMNTLMGDPTTDKLLPLVDVAAEVGAEYFCIDSGWYDNYDDNTAGWWDSVGEWLPSASRFPDGGIERVLERIRDRGMVPGLWLEPEVVGVRSPIAAALPDQAFLSRGGVRITEFGRHQLDLRHPAALAHLDRAVDRIVGEWGVGYLKLDYNITVAAADGGLLGHARAYLEWLRGLLDRYPGLVVENCASGGMRMDGSSLAVTQLQSTSDQQDPLRYPPIAASSPTAVPPEQGAVWACPQPEFTDAEIDFALGGALLGRVHLSGHLDRMTAHQRGLVRDALSTYKHIRDDLPAATPFWPLGLPGWDDPWVALGMRAERCAYLLVWRRDATGPDELSVPLGDLRGDTVSAVEVLHPTGGDAKAALRPGAAEVGVTLPRTPTAALLRLTYGHAR